MYDNIYTHKYNILHNVKLDIIYHFMKWPLGGSIKQAEAGGFSWALCITNIWRAFAHVVSGGWYVVTLC